MTKMKTAAVLLVMAMGLMLAPATARAHDGVAPPPPPQVTAGPLDSAAWDYVDADLTTYQVTRFELCLDGAVAGCATVEPAVGKFVPATAPPPAGTSSYRLKLPAMTPGPHTLVVRACNVSGCSEGGTPVAFNMAITPPSVIWRGFVGGAANDASR